MPHNRGSRLPNSPVPLVVDRKVAGTRSGVNPGPLFFVNMWPWLSLLESACLALDEMQSFTLPADQILAQVQPWTKEAMMQVFDGFTGPAVSQSHARGVDGGSFR